MGKKTFFKTAFGILKETVSTFMENRGLKLSASLAYYTLFSMAPLLLLVILRLNSMSKSNSVYIIIKWFVY